MKRYFDEPVTKRRKNYPPLRTIKEIAGEMNIPEKEIRVRLRRGDGPRWKIGERIKWYNADDFKKWWATKAPRASLSQTKDKTQCAPST